MVIPIYVCFQAGELPIILKKKTTPRLGTTFMIITIYVQPIQLKIRFYGNLGWFWALDQY